MNISYWYPKIDDFCSMQNLFLVRTDKLNSKLINRLSRRVHKGGFRNSNASKNFRKFLNVLKDEQY